MYFVLLSNISFVLPANKKFLYRLKYINCIAQSDSIVPPGNKNVLYCLSYINSTAHNESVVLPIVVLWHCPIIKITCYLITSFNPRIIVDKCWYFNGLRPKWINGNTASFLNTLFVLLYIYVMHCWWQYILYFFLWGSCTAYDLLITSIKEYKRHKITSSDTVYKSISQ